MQNKINSCLAFFAIIPPLMLRAYDNGPDMEMEEILLKEGILRDDDGRLIFHRE
jgi:hypothetical protein